MVDEYITELVEKSSRRTPEEFKVIIDKMDDTKFYELFRRCRIGRYQRVIYDRMPMFMKKDFYNYNTRIQMKAWFLQETTTAKKLSSYLRTINHAKLIAPFLEGVTVADAYGIMQHRLWDFHYKPLLEALINMISSEQLDSIIRHDQGCITGHRLLEYVKNPEEYLGVEDVSSYAQRYCTLQNLYDLLPQHHKSYSLETYSLFLKCLMGYTPTWISDRVGEDLKGDISVVLQYLSKSPDVYDNGNIVPLIFEAGSLEDVQPFLSLLRIHTDEEAFLNYLLKLDYPTMVREMESHEYTLYIARVEELPNKFIIKFLPHIYCETTVRDTLKTFRDDELLKVLDLYAYYKGSDYYTLTLSHTVEEALVNFLSPKYLKEMLIRGTIDGNEILLKLAERLPFEDLALLEGCNEDVQQAINKRLDNRAMTDDILNNTLLDVKIFNVDMVEKHFTYCFECMVFFIQNENQVFHSVNYGTGTCQECGKKGK